MKGGRKAKEKGNSQFIYQTFPPLPGLGSLSSKCDRNLLPGLSVRTLRLLRPVQCPPSLCTREEAQSPKGCNCSGNGR